MGSSAKSYMRKGFLIYEKMRQYLVILTPLFGNMKTLRSKS